MPLAYKPTDLELRSCFLYNYAGEKLDIRNIMLEFNIYHSIFSNATKIDVAILDGNGLVEIFPIVGEETLEIEFKTPTFEKTLNYFFRIYNVSDKDKFETRSDKYILHGTSQEVVSNLRKSVNKSYVDMPISTIVKGIYNSFLKPTEEEYTKIKKNKTLSIQETNDNFSVVFTGEKPITAIKYLSQEAQTKNDQEGQGSNFYFFEKSDGYYFETIDGMLLKDPSYDFYFTLASNEDHATQGEKIDDDKKITNYSFVNQVNTLKNLARGLYAHNIETIDPITKRFTTDNFSYKNDSKKITHIEHDKKKIDDTFLYSEDSLLSKDSGTSVNYYMISNIGEDYNKQPYLSKAITNDPQIRNPRKLHKFLKYNVAAKAQLSNIVLSITIPGNTKLEIGDVVNLHIPQSSELPELSKKLNLLYDKKFLVVSIRHTFNKKNNKFYTIFECRKDTYAKKAEKVE
jgi:hypothetical protein